MARLDELLSPDELSQMLSLKGSLPSAPSGYVPQAVLDQGYNAVQDYEKGARPFPTLDDSSAIAPLGGANATQKEVDPDAIVSEAARGAPSSLFGQVSNQYANQQQLGNVGATPPPAPPVAQEESDEEEAPSRGTASAKAAPTPEKQQDYLDTLIGQLKGSIGGNTGLTEAQNAQRDIMNSAGMGMVGQQIAAALSRGNYKPDYSSQEQMFKQAQLPVQNVLQQQSMLKEKIDQGLKLSDLQDKQELRDPKSLVSQAYRSSMAGLMPKLATDPNYQNMSAETLKQLQPVAAAITNHQMMQMYRQSQVDYKMKQDSAKSKADMASKIQMTMNRGTPSIANQTVLAADKILDLFKNKPDPNTWDNNEITLYRTELLKAAKGGTPAAGEAHSLFPPTVGSSLSNVAQRVTGESVPAGMGPIIMNTLPYVQNIRSSSQKFLRENVLNPMTTGYNKRVTPDDMMEYKQSLPHLYPEVAGSVPKTAAPAPSVSTDPRVQMFRALHPDSTATDAELIKALEGK